MCGVFKPFGQTVIYFKVGGYDILKPCWISAEQYKQKITVNSIVSLLVDNNQQYDVLKTFSNLYEQCIDRLGL